MKNISRPLRGWVISLLLHAAALAWLVHQAAPPRPDDTPARHSMLVFVAVPPEPPPKPEPEPEPEPASRRKAAAAPARPSAKPSRPAPQPVIASTAPTPAAAENAQPATSAAAPADGPVFDVDAARATARAVAKEEGGAARGGATLKETQDEKLGRAIEKSRRKDCKTRYSGMGVLAIIPLVKDTVTDTGCKW